jgi:aldehyde:ferredoxin oxidoreductase
MEFYSAITGMEADAASLLKKGERIWNLMKLLNVRLGLGRTDDRSPDAFLEPKKVHGREMPMMDYFKNAIITKEDTERMLDDYYDERGWNKETGEPTQEKLKELGLEEFSC